VKINELAKSHSHAHWYMKRIEEFLAAYPRESISAHRAARITAWFSKLGRNKRLQPWQFGQCVWAIKILLEMVSASAFREID
jgi:hypothetical protein